MPGGARRDGVDDRISDYALIGDCHTSALVSTDGSIDWLCFPRPDSPAIFAHILDDRHGGNFTVRVEAATAHRSYLEDTNVLVTTWQTPDGGRLEVTDCMPITAGPGGRPVAHRGIVRRLRTTAGSVTAEVRVTPRFEYGLVVPRLRMVSDHVADFVGGGSALRVESDRVLERRPAKARRGDVLAASWTLAEGDTAWVVARWSPAHEAPSDDWWGLRDPAEAPAPDVAEWEQLLDATVEYWRGWIGASRYKGGNGPAVRRSALVLKALTYAPSGAVIAAPTTSLPEWPGGERNWDYRYTWIRDATLTLASLFLLGLREEGDAFKAWLERTGAGRPQDLQIMYGVGGERLLPEVVLDHLRGHRGSRPVRIGNGAVKQLQLDSYGQILESAYLYHRAGGQMTEDNWRYLSGLADICCDRWRQPDCGIWELRGEPRHFVHSKVNCWLALQRASQMAAVLGSDGTAALRWAGGRDALGAALLDDARKRGWFAQAWGGDDADAAALLVPAVGFVPAGDPLVDATVANVLAELSDGTGLLRRYHADDGLAGGEGAFLLCSFWLVDVWAHAGRLDAAADLLARLLGLANDVGLYAEEVDPATGAHLGNFPQAFTHMALVTTCSHLAAALEGALPADGGPHDFTELALERVLAAGMPAPAG